MNEFQKFETQIKEQEKIVQQEVQKLNQLHGSRPPEIIERDYEFKSMFRSTKLADLFGENDELIIIHNMGKQCNYCALWADGFNGYYQQLARRTSFAVVSNDLPEVQHQLAVSRKWQFPMFSCKGSNFFEDMGFSENSEGKTTYLPGLSVFRKINGKIERTTRASFGPGDLFSSIWNLFSILPKGINGWTPSDAPLVEPKGQAKIDGFNVAAVYCENPEISANFYKEILGFEVSKNTVNAGVLLYNKEADLTLYLGNDQPPQVSLCFNSVVGVAGAAKILQAKGIEIVHQYGSAESGFAGIQFKDPSGNLLEIAGSP